MAISSTIAQPSSPSIHSTTRPRTTIGSNGLSTGVKDSATRGSRRRLRALRECGPVRKTILSSRVLTKIGTACGEPSGRTVARCAITELSRWLRTSGLSIVGLLSGDFVVEVGDTGCGNGFDEAEPHVFGQGLEERAAAAEQDRHLVEDDLVDQACLQGRSQDAAAHEADILGPSDFTRRGHRVLDAGRDEDLPVTDLGRRTVAEDDQTGSRVRAAAAEVLGVLVCVASGDHGADATGEVIEDPGGLRCELEALEDLAPGVATAEPVEQHRSVAEPAARAGITTGDVTVDRDGVGAENLRHGVAPSEFLQETS